MRSEAYRRENEGRELSEDEEPEHRGEDQVVSNICRYYTMSRAQEANVEDETDFKWGNKRGDGVKNKDV
ncbi:uncharacterized protein G2W53_004118 [Senna tora]|uniref:Uncharacterized protein n=2 Tax=Senna tora TaxID=362788 RepID=A0A834XC22_9FABA|nr:uncharacterized protein G2W53_004118 [Senna tora]